MNGFWLLMMMYCDIRGCVWMWFLSMVGVMFLLSVVIRIFFFWLVICR